EQELHVAPAAETSALREQIEADTLRPASPAPATNPALPPLPAPPRPLLGRVAEIGLIVKRLHEPTCQMVTLTGPGGVGKTHLGLAAARALQDRFEHGALFVSLATITDADQVIPAIAHALGASELHGHSPFANLAAALDDRHMLVVLDNFEQVVDAAPHIGELLAHLPRLKLLVTSRAALRLRAEHEIAIPPLELPAPPWLAVALARSPAITLFVQRAQAVLPTFTLTDANAGAVAEICTRLDGLPLAIELAAARVKLLPPQLLVQRLGNRLDLLTGGKRDMPTRHQTLRNTIDWSYNLLETHEQLLFARLAVFMGGCTLEAAEAICQTGSEHTTDILDGLQALIDSSLIRQMASEDGLPRLTSLEMIREYALERLLASGEEETVRGQHATYYLRLAEDAAPELAGGPAQVLWFGRVSEELDNIRAALRWAVGRKEAGIALRLSVALREFWMTRGHLREGRSWLEAALALGEQAAGRAALRGNAFTAAGWLAANARDYAAADELFNQSLALARRTEEPAQIIAVLGDLAQAVRMQGDMGRAAALYRDRLALCREEGDARGAAWSLCNLGIIAHAEGHDAKAEPLLEEGASVAQAQGDRICAAWCRTFLARVAKDRGEFARSAALFAETLALFREVGHTDGIAFTLEGWAGLAAIAGDLRSAARIFGAAEALREAINRVQPAYHRDTAASADTNSPAWRAAWAEGKALLTDQAIAEVLEEVSRLAA
ncbi:MAG: tetratricopeptide repeat protein, partial [Chloroflexales bacterium]|nr:tetratricopeptide repeat protein [Chloroflexales bacterium]